MKKVANRLDDSYIESFYSVFYRIFSLLAGLREGNKILMTTPCAVRTTKGDIPRAVHLTGHRKYLKNVDTFWNHIERQCAELEAASFIIRNTTEVFKNSVVNINSSIKNLKYIEKLKGTESFKQNSENVESSLGKRRGTVSDDYDSLTKSDVNESPCEMTVKRRMIQNASSSSLISIMEKYRVKQTTSKFDLAHSYILDLTPKSKIEGEFDPKLWAELIADRPVMAKTEYHKEIESICDHLFGPLCKKKQPKLYESRDKWKTLRYLKVPEYNDDFSYYKEEWEKILYWAEHAIVPFLNAFESECNPIQRHNCGEREWFGEYVVPIFKGALRLNTSYCVSWGEVTVIATLRRKNQEKNVLEHHLERGHLADLVCEINQQEIVCGLGCGGPRKYDLTKWGSDEYQLPRMLKDMLDDILEKIRSRNGCTSNIYTIGIQQCMAEIRIYMMEKRDVYRLHLLKSFDLPLTHSSYGILRLALSWAWNIKGLVENLSFELNDRICFF
ncbi:8411_t:CDS:10 [Acaulospora morrowiae]|uniref:8411_t:CDS:1 n=1 Tax=Acaulospora morrowiae TaxID=94023 RepID=A0A9N9FYG5_9GLOM|nr:8411_t:CDS:10 [Acaulospora morrowiae]